MTNNDLILEFKNNLKNLSRDQVENLIDTIQKEREDIYVNYIDSDFYPKEQLKLLKDYKYRILEVDSVFKELCIFTQFFFDGVDEMTLSDFDNVFEILKQNIYYKLTGEKND